jgi:type I restriction enzyme S subunit
MRSKKMKFKDIVLGENGLLKGPFGSDLKKSIYIPKSKNTYKVYLQENILKRDITKGNHHISSEYFYSSMSRYEVNNDDFIVTCDGTLGEILQLKNLSEPGIISSSLLRISLDPKIINDKFFFYFFKHRIKNPLIRQHDNSVLKHLPGLKAIREFEFELIDINSQIPIGKLLSSLDSKIELNNRINSELEAIAKTLYDYWFIQFDFPDKNGNPYKTSGGKMVWNEELKREVPEGWEVGELKDIANITMGQSPPGESYNEDGEGMIFYQGCTDFGNRFPTVRKFTTEPTRYAKEGDILLSVRAPVGTLNISKENCCIGRGLASLNSKDNCIGYLFGVMVNLKQIFDRRNVDGTTFGSITKDDLFSLKVVKPTSTILKKYHNAINSSFEKQNQLELENIKLAELRDWLLPMLMNGQVRVN